MNCMRKGIAALLALTATAALAHAHLQNSVPGNGAVVNVAPASVTLKFSEAARLTACWIQKGDGPKQKVGGFPSTPAQQVSVPLSHLGPGTYVVSWRVLGDDGHVVPGQIHFTVAAAPASGKH